MSKYSISHGQTVPMNMFATWEVDRSSPQCIPRVCSLALGRLVIIKELDRDVQSVFIAVKMQGPKRVLRSYEIVLPSNGLLDIQLELTFSLQYPHFVKRDGNLLQIMLQRKKRYKNRAILGYKTLAVANLDMSQIIQSPIVEEHSFDLVSTSKERGGSDVVVAQVNVSSVYSTPTDEGEVSFGRIGKTSETDRSPDADNYSDDETFSSDPEMGSDVNPQEWMDEDNVPKHKERRKVRMSSSSRQQNFIKAKLVALLRKFKQVADEQGLEPNLVQGQADTVPDEVDLDFLYDEIEDLNLSDSCPEVEDNISIVSTPKPKLKPFFDRTSHSSSQTEVCSLRDQVTDVPGYGYYDSNNGSYRRNHGTEATNFHSLQASKYTPAIDQTDSSEDEGSITRRRPSRTRPGLVSDESGSEGGSSTPKLFNTPSHKDEKSRPRSISPSFDVKNAAETVLKNESSVEDLGAVAGSDKSLSVIHGSFASEDTELEEAGGGTSLPSILILVDMSEKNGHALADAFQSNLSTCKLADIVVLGTSTVNQLRTVFSALIAKLQRFVNNNSNQPMTVKVCLAGAESYINHILQEFVELLSSRPPDWISYFLFLPVLLDKQRLASYLCSLDAHYARLFGDHTWRDFFDSLNPQKLNAISPNAACPPGEVSSTAASFEKQQLLEKTLTLRVLEYINEASATFPLHIAEAMLTFECEGEHRPQRFIPFISGTKIGDNELSQLDSDREDGCPTGPTAPSGNAGAPAGHVVGSFGTPLSPSIMTSANPAHHSAAASADLKMGLQVDYWKGKDSTKYTLKSNFRSFHVSSLPEMGECTPGNGLSIEFVTVGKKNLMRLPGKKGKEKEADSKSQVINYINRLICATKHQHFALKVTIDGIEWKEVKFFQLSSHWSTHVKVFPVGLFSLR